VTISRRFALAIAALVIAAAGVAGLRSATSFRFDAREAGTVSIVTMSVRNKGEGSLDVDARVLWGVCTRQLSSEQRAAKVVVREAVLRAEIRPALGDHQRRQVRGCLEDLTVRQVMGSVRSIETRGG
jgi:hypothetical protein